MKPISPLELLEQKLLDHRVVVVHNTPPLGVKGLYWDDKESQIIVLSPEIKTEAERLCVLAEEAGHHCTSAGNILYLHTDKVLSRRQERRAMGWAYERLVPLEKLIKAWLDHIRTPWELAEYCGVTVKFLVDALEYYKQKHAPVWRVDQYAITFEPFNISNKGT